MGFRKRSFLHRRPTVALFTVWYAEIPGEGYCAGGSTGCSLQLTCVKFMFTAMCPPVPCPYTYMSSEKKKTDIEVIRRSFIFAPLVSVVANALLFVLPGERLPDTQRKRRPRR